MDPKIEDLRRRFLPPRPDSKTSPSEKFHSTRQTSAAQEVPYKDSTPQTADQERLVGALGPEQLSPEEITSSDEPQEFSDAGLLKPLDQAVEEIFKPAQLCRENLAEAINSSQLFHQLTGDVMEVLESLQRFRDQMRKLSSTFSTMRSFQYDLGALADSFEPVKPLHHEVVHLTDSIKINLAQVARSLEPANALRVRASEFVQVLEKLTELQAQFHQLSKAFADAGKSDRNARDSRMSKT